LRKTLYWGVRLSLKPFLAPWIPISIQRGWSNFAALSTLAPKDVGRSMLDMDGVPALLLRPAQCDARRIILYLHGGAYILGGPASHGKLAAQIGHAAHARVYLADYRLAPEHPFPAALDDAVAAYRWLLAQGNTADQISIAGDSAGGGLALAAAIAIRDSGLPQPAALLLISPWVDLSLGGESVQTLAARDPMLRPSWLALGARAYCSDKTTQHPACSPLFASLAGLPPMLIQVGSEEILRDDSLRLEQRAKAAGVRVQLHVYEQMWHDFQVHAGLLDEADAALAEIGSFVEAHATA